MRIAYAVVQAMFANTRKRMLAHGIGEQQSRHNEAVLTPSDWAEVTLTNMIHMWALYAQAHSKAYDTAICFDGLLGPAWQAIGQHLRALLNGQTGRLDCNTLDSYIVTTMRVNGCTVIE